MAVAFTPLHPCFAAQASPVALREVFDPAILDAVRDGMDEHAVLVFGESRTRPASSAGRCPRVGSSCAT